MVIEMMIVFLLGWIIFSLTQNSREGLYVEYEEDCTILAKQNETNLAALKEEVKEMSTLNDQVKQLQIVSDSNKQQLSTLTDQLYKNITP
jgi:hypothetical protein